MPRTGWDALFAGLVAAGVTALLTPLASRLARRVGAVDEPRERGLSDRPTPRLGGLAIFAGVLLAGARFLPIRGERWRAVGAGAAPVERPGGAGGGLRPRAPGQPPRPGG